MTTTIEWTDETWNPTRGCQLVSPGCHNCYAMKQGHRFSGKGGPYEGLTRLRKKGGPVWTGKGLFVEDALDAPLHWREPRRVFVNSMSDLFFEKFSNEEIAAVFGVMAASPQHTFQVLTKRASRMRQWFGWLTANNQDARWRIHDEARARVVMTPQYVGSRWPLPNVWLGVSVEEQWYANERIPFLLETPAAVRFVSYEPALGPVDFSPFLSPGYIASRGGQDSFDGLDWIIVGGESGPGARPFDVAWARSVVAQCKAAGVACFVKQFGRRVRRVVPGSAFIEDAVATVIEASMKHKKGADMSEWPEDLSVREWPEKRP